MAELSTLQRTDSRILGERWRPLFKEGANSPIAESGAVLFIEGPSGSSIGDVANLSPNAQAHLDFSIVKWIEDSRTREVDSYLQGQNANPLRSLETRKAGLPEQTISIFLERIKAWLDEHTAHIGFTKDPLMLESLISEGNRSPFVHYSTTTADMDLKSWLEMHRLVNLEYEQVSVYAGRKHLAAKLQASFEENPVEDGMEHAAEEIIANAFAAAKGAHVLSWFREFCADASQPSFAASVLRCLGRCEGIGTVSWRVRLVRDGLASANVEIRDASVQAAESWGDSEMVKVLRAHDEPEPWLRQYALDVIEDLTG